MLHVPRTFCLVGDDHDHSLLSALAEAGIEGFQVRAKALDGRALTGLTRLVIAAARPFGARVYVNDRVDVALAAGADGVHLGAEDLDVASARLIAPDLEIGATCRTREDVEAAADAGATYAGFGPIFATSSKAELPEPLGTHAIGGAADVLPLVAIGGISPANAAAALNAGADGIAVIGAIWDAVDPVAAAKELTEAVRS